MRALVTVALVAVAVPAAARTIFVGHGQSIQAAVDRAQPGDTVAVDPGTYHEAGRPCPTNPATRCAVVVTKNDISLVGRANPNHPVVLEAVGDQNQGIAVARPGATGARCLTDRSQRLHGVEVDGFTVNGFAGEGIFLFCVDDWEVAHGAAHDNGEYGIFPSHCGSGRVYGNVVTGSNDTGIYVGQSHDVRVDHNTTMGNVSGYEIENSSGVRLDHNVAVGNTGGILSFTLPFLDVHQNHDNVIEHNEVHANNRANTCLDPSDAVCQVPPGTGILLVAADNNVVEHNRVTGNDSFGIGVVNYCVATGDPACGSAGGALLDIEPNSDDDTVQFNDVTHNGAAPDPGVPAVFAVDLAWDTTGTGNCWRMNVAETTFPADQPGCE